MGHLICNFEPFNDPFTLAESGKNNIFQSEGPSREVGFTSVQQLSQLLDLLLGSNGLSPKFFASWVVLGWFFLLPFYPHSSQNK